MSNESSTRTPIHQRPLQSALIAGLVVALIAAVTAVFLQDDSGNRDDQRGWFDASGHRAGIVTRDQLTPWFDYPTFNRIKNNRELQHDERAFLDGLVVGRGQYWTNRLDVRPGDVVRIRAYIVNEAEPVLNDSVDQRGIALGTRLTVGIPPPPLRGESSITALVSAQNAQPRWIADTLILNFQAAGAIDPTFREAWVYSYCDASGVPHSFAEGANQVAIPQGELIQHFTAKTAKEFAGTGQLIGCGPLDGRLAAGHSRVLEVQMDLAIAER